LSIGAGQADLTVHSFGYNTAEAVPMTVYYRGAGEDQGGKARPSLDHLRHAEMKQQPEAIQVVIIIYITIHTPLPSFPPCQLCKLEKNLKSALAIIELCMYMYIQEVWQGFPWV
jgi:hypothetical protein